MPFITPDAAIDTAAFNTCLAIPADYSHIVRGLLNELVFASNWEKHGADTVQEAIDKMYGILDTWGSSCMPVGTIIMMAVDDPPTGYLRCNGRKHDEADYPELHAVLSSQYIVDATEFKTPDIDGRVVVGVGDGGGLTERFMDDAGGTEEHQLSVAELAKHDHLYLPPFVNLDIEGPGIPDAGATVVGTNVATQEAGGNVAHENMPPFIALNYFIKALP